MVFIFEPVILSPSPRWLQTVVGKALSDQALIFQKYYCISLLTDEKVTYLEPSRIRMPLVLVKVVWRLAIYPLWSLGFRLFKLQS